jgi:hypothetical protein
MGWCRVAVPPGVPLLSCTTVCADAAPEVACCRLAPFHRDPGVYRARRYPSDTIDA